MYRSGDIGFAIGKSELSKTITAVAGKFSHTFQFIEIGGVLCVFDAQIEGCYPMEFGNWMNKFGYEIVVLRSLKTDPNFTRNCVHYFGIKYDVKGLGVGLFRSLLRCKNMHEKFRDNGKFWCFELTARLLHFPCPENWNGEQIYAQLIKKGYKKV